MQLMTELQNNYCNLSESPAELTYLSQQQLQVQEQQQQVQIINTTLPISEGQYLEASEVSQDNSNISQHFEHQSRVTVLPTDENTITTTTPISTGIPTNELSIINQQLSNHFEAIDPLEGACEFVAPIAGAITASNNNNNNNNNYTFAFSKLSSANMNIQPTSYTKNHLINNNGANDELSIKKRREDLSRRPSYRKIFNDLTGLASAPGPLDSPTATALAVPPPPPPVMGLNQLAPPVGLPPSRQSPQQQQAGGNQTNNGGSQPTPPAAGQVVAKASQSPQALDLLSSVGVSAAAAAAAAAANLQDPTQASQSPVSVVDLQTNPAQLSQQHSAAVNQQQHHHHLHLPPPPPQQQQQQQQPSVTASPNHLHHHHHQQQLPHHHQQHQQQQQQQQPHHHHHHHQQQQQSQQQQHHHHHHQQQQQQLQHTQVHQQQQQHHQLLAATSPPITGSVVVGTEEANKKRELRLQKNREAAKECRRKKKEYIKCLENRVAVLENQNKALIDELKTLKDLYCKSANE